MAGGYRDLEIDAPNSAVAVSMPGTRRAIKAWMKSDKTTETEKKGAPPVDDGKKPAGDNRGLGDADGNRTGGDSKSPGATDPKDDPGDAGRH